MVKRIVNSIEHNDVCNISCDNLVFEWQRLDFDFENICVEKIILTTGFRIRDY